MEKPTLRLFIAAAFVAALTGCPGPQPGNDTGTPPPPDSGIPDDSGSDPGDAGVDAHVPPGDSGADTGTIPSTCDDVEYVGIECNLPDGMDYDMSAFSCASFINNDLWLSDAPGSSPQGVISEMRGGRLIVGFPFTRDNAGVNMPPGMVLEYTCGNEGHCWLNWFNPDSRYSHCRVSFSTDCGDATVECWMPGSSDPETSYAAYVGPA